MKNRLHNCWQANVKRTVILLRHRGRGRGRQAREKAAKVENGVTGKHHLNKINTSIRLNFPNNYAN
jgi:hypothetical protein